LTRCAGVLVSAFGEAAKKKNSGDDYFTVLSNYKTRTKNRAKDENGNEIALTDIETMESASFNAWHKHFYQSFTNENHPTPFHLMTRYGQTVTLTVDHQGLTESKFEGCKRGQVGERGVRVVDVGLARGKDAKGDLGGKGKRRAGTPFNFVDSENEVRSYNSV
jgi:hypothetical protein